MKHSLKPGAYLFVMIAVMFTACSKNIDTKSNANLLATTM